jgi:hypothetical protein
VVFHRHSLQSKSKIDIEISNKVVSEQYAKKFFQQFFERHHREQGGAIGMRVAATKRINVSFVIGASCIVRTTSKLLARSTGASPAKT